METCSEKALLERVRAGDDSGFETLVATHSPRVLALAHRLTGNREDAEDIAQEAFLRLHRSLVDFRGESSVGTWLHRTATRLAIDHLRRRRLRDRIFFFRRTSEEPDPLEIVPDPAPSQRDRLQTAEIRRGLDRALQQLTARQRAVFTLRHFEGLPLKEIAESLRIEEGTVKAHLHRAVEAVRREMDHLQGDKP